jgi:hypothetical protein
VVCVVLGAADMVASVGEDFIISNKSAALREKR